MKSSNSVILYELFECEEGINTYKPLTTMAYSLEKLKKVFGISEEKYPEFKIFKRAVLTPATKEISRTSSIEVIKTKPVKKGRKTVGVTFIIQKKPAIRVEDGQLGLTLDKNQDWVNTLITIGLSSHQIESLVTDYKYDDDLNYYNVKAIQEYIDNCAKKKKEIKSRIALVRKGFSENWGEKAYKIFKKDQETREAMERRSQFLKVEEDLNEKLRRIEQKFSDHINTLANDAYITLETQAQENAKEHFYDITLGSNSLYKEKYPSVEALDLENDVIIKSLWKEYLKQNMEFTIPVYETWCEENGLELIKTRQEVTEVKTLMYGE